MISQLEVGLKQPTEMLLNALCDALGFEPGFFFDPLVDEFRDDQCNFRRRVTTSLTVRNRVLAHGTLFEMLVLYFDSILRLPPHSVPQHRAESREDIERAAEKCRLEWGVGLDLPIKNMCRVLERAGVVVAKFDADAEKVDAFSRPGRRHIVVLNTDKDSPSRTRFDLAHECGHLVMHQGMETGTPEQEEQANQFASAFLLPRTGFLREFPSNLRLDWDAIFSIKARWGVSLAAIVRRAYDLRRIDGVQYQRAYKYIHSKGWHRGEPNEPEPESPELIPTSFELMGAHFRQTHTEIAQHLHWKLDTLERVSGVQRPPTPEPSESRGADDFLR